MTTPLVTGENLGGLLGADAICQTAADDNGLDGDFMAWLSAGSSSPANRFTNVANAGPYQLVPIGATPPPIVAANFADLTSCDGVTGICIQNAINREADGTNLSGSFAVWTGTLSDGTAAAADDTCAGWTGAGSGLIGSTNAVNDDWTDTQSFSQCTFLNMIYCFQQA